MKKLIASLIVLFCFGIANASIGDRFTVTDDGGSDVLRLTSGNQLTPAVSTLELGSSAFPFSEINVSSYTNPIIVTEYFSDLATGTTFAMYTTGEAGISTATATRYFGTSTLTQPGDARNVICAAYFAVGSATQTATISWTIAGTNSLGNSVTETLTSTAPTTVVGNWAYVYVDSVSFTMTNCSETRQYNICIDIGLGNKIGLSNKVVTSTDIYGVKEGTALVSVGSETISTTYNTIDFITDGGGSNDYKVWYKARKAP